MHFIFIFVVVSSNLLRVVGCISQYLIMILYHKSSLLLHSVFKHCIIFQPKKVANFCRHFIGWCFVQRGPSPNGQNLKNENQNEEHKAINIFFNLLTLLMFVSLTLLLSSARQYVNLAFSKVLACASSSCSDKPYGELENSLRNCSWTKCKK